MDYEHNFKQVQNHNRQNQNQDWNKDESTNYDINQACLDYEYEVFLIRWEKQLVLLSKGDEKRRECFDHK